MNRFPSSAAIRFLSGPEQGQAFPCNKVVMTIGRDRGQNDIFTNDETISRQHARMLYENGAWSIEKTKPTAIIKVNQQDIVQRQALKDQDILTLGGKDTTFVFLANAPQYHNVGPAPVSGPVAGVWMGGGVGAQGAPGIPLQGVPMQATRTMREPSPGVGGAGGIGGIGGALTPPTLEVSTNTGAIKMIPHVLDKQVMGIGRHPSNEIVIDEPIISQFHFQIVREHNGYVLIHPHPQAHEHRTTNGLLYQGHHTKGTEPFRKQLVSGDVFRVGNELGTLVTLTYKESGGVTREIVPVMRPIELNVPTVTIGRAPDNVVVLNHPQVSAHHGRVVREGSGHRIIDQGSTNHTYVNGRVVGNQPLRPGDEIRIGPYKLTYTGTHLSQQDESKSIRVDALSLNKVGNNQTILLHDISVAIPARSFVALVGGSGAGKSTLMDALNGLRPAKGAVYYNGQDYYHSLAAFSTQIGYVPQDDIVHRELTVERALYYAAKLRLPEDFTDAQINQRIDEVLVDVDMKHRRKLLINKLSGGQRKRVSIALELLANPSIFFLDEPTSGLDPGLDRKMMLLLRRLADRGHTVVLVTHATNNIISNCDYVCFLAAGGRLAYFGPPAEAMTFFGQNDFADIYSALEPTEMDQDIPAKAEQRFRGSDDYRKYVTGQLMPSLRQGAIMQAPTGNLALKRGDPWKQFRLLSMRYIELLRNDTVNLLILLLQAPVMGLLLVLLIAYVIKKPFDSSTFGVQGGGLNAEKILFMMAFSAIMFGCINAAREIVKEAPIYRRERIVNLGIVPYLFSKFVVLGALCLLQCAILVFMVNLASPFPKGIFLPVGLEIYITLSLTSLTGLMMGLTLSALVPNNDRAMSIVPLLILPQVIFAGVIFELSGFSVFLGGFFSARWAMIGMGSSIGLTASNAAADSFAYQSNAGHLLLAWFVLAVMIVAFGAATGYFMKRKDTRV